MSTEREEHMDLDAARYVDGRMDGDERARFEARLTESASLRAEVEVLRRADDSIRRAFAGIEPIDLGETPAPATAGRLGADGVAPRQSSWRTRAWMLVGAVGVAAAIVLAGLPILMRTPTRPIRSGGPGMTAEGVYSLEESRAWAIDHVCATNKDFAAYSQRKVGEALVADAGHVPGVQIVGWAGYDIDLRGAGLDGRACLIVARAEGKPVLVFLDPGGARNRLSADGSGGLRVFRRELGSVSLYEVTPLGEPHVIGVFEEAPAELLEGGAG